MTSHKIGTREQWAAAREELLAREKEPHPAGRRTRTAAARAAVGPGRQGLTASTPTRHAHAGRTVRWPQPAAHLPFHVRPSYAAGCPTCSSIADSVNGVSPP